MPPGGAIDLVLFVGSADEPPPLDAALKPGQCEAYRAESALAPRAERPVRLPRGQLHCMNTVLRIARSTGLDVTVVDVDRPAGRQHLVDRWAGERGALPLLVRSDGRRLAGPDQFLPARVRAFLAGQ